MDEVSIKATCICLGIFFVDYPQIFQSLIGKSEQEQFSNCERNVFAIELLRIVKTIFVTL